MRTIITVTLRGNKTTMEVTAQPAGKAPFHVATCNDPGEAAAHAMQAAINFGGGGYQIFAPSKVMEQIPEDMRGKSHAG